MFDENLIKGKIRSISDYPKKGILFRDITTLLNDRNAFNECIDELAARLPKDEIDYVIGIEARGFIIASALAYKLRKGFVPVRKRGKLPHDTIRRDYDLEYGSETIEMHKDALERGSSVVIADDLLATGGTAKASADIVTEVGSSISAIAFLVELSELRGREKLKGHNVVSLVKY